jgi:hypothetical protein
MGRANFLKLELLRKYFYIVIDDLFVVINCYIKKTAGVFFTKFKSATCAQPM